MQANTRIILMATIAAGIGALVIGSSLATAAFAWLMPGMMQQQQTSQSIQQSNECSYAKCSNTATNVVGGGGGSTSQSITQSNDCNFAKCSNTATNVVGFKWW